MITSDYRECMSTVRQFEEGKEDGEVINRFRLRIVDPCTCSSTNDRTNVEMKRGNSNLDDDDEAYVDRRIDVASSCRCFNSITLYSRTSTTLHQVGKQLTS